MTVTSFRITLGVLLATAAMPAVAYAAAPETAAEAAPDAAYDAAAYDAADNGDAIVVTASGREQKIAQAPASISVLDREELENRPFTSLEDAVRNVEGVSINGENNAKDIVIRGMPGEYTVIMLDGRRQTTRETMNRGTGGVQSHLLPPLAAIERIEVVRGPMSSLYGSDAMGGVINVITRKVPERAAGTITLGGIVQEDGDYGNTTLGNFWVGTPLFDGRVGVQVYGGIANRAEDDIYFPKSLTSGSNRIRDRNINAKLSFLINPDHSITLAGGHSDLEYRDTPGLSIAANAARADDDHNRDYYSLAYEGKWDFGTSRLSVYRENEDFATFSNGNLLNKPELTNTTVDASLNVPFGAHNVTVGGQYIHAKVTGIGRQDSVSGYVNVDKVVRESWALFGEGQVRPVEPLIITVGGRVDHYDQFGSHFTPRVYANYTIVPGLTLRGGYAGGFKAPTIRQSEAGYCMTSGGGVLPRGPLCGNPDLKPETSNTKEIGLRYDGPDKLMAGLTLFDTRFKNKVVSYVTDQMDPKDPTRPIYVYDNVDRVRIKGIEATVAVPVGPSVLVSANYTYTNSKRKGGGEPAFDGSSLDGFPLDKSPEHMANARIGWDVDDQVNLYASAFYTGKQYWSAFRNGATKSRLRPASTTYDIGATFKVNDNFALRAAVLNVTNKIVPIDERGRFEGLDGNWMLDEGRRFWGTATVSF